MSIKHLFSSAAAVFIAYILSIAVSGCAQIGSPTGGPRDTIPPKLVSSDPQLMATNFKGNKIIFTFNEYIDVKDVQNNVLVSPFPKVNPQISFKLKTVTVKLKDTLLGNTTYAINFGNAISDNNENNPFKNFTYVFSTGNSIDSLKLSGKVVLAESGKIDTTIIAMLYRNAPDSAVQNRKPNYIAKVNSEGKFKFTNLSAGSYKVYALKDGDGGKTYNSKVEVFAFNNTDVMVSDSTTPVSLFAYAEEKEKKAAPKEVAKAGPEKKFKYNLSLNPTTPQDLLTPLELSFTKQLKDPDFKKIILTDTNFKKVNGTVLSIDSTKKIIYLKNAWKEDESYKLIISKDAVSDTLGNTLAKTDTISFKTKKERDYGSILIHFKNPNAAAHPVLQFFKADILVKSIPITGNTWSDKLFEPGEYELRILYDDNNNGIWDPGNYLKKIQPEKAITLDKRLTIKANWDNERDVTL